MPAIAAIIVRKWVTNEGFADAGLRPNIKSSWWYYICAAVLPLVVVGCIVVLATLFGLGHPDFSLMRALPTLLPGYATSGVALPAITPLLWVGLIAQLLIVGVPFATFVTWGEEFGWRGYLQRRLSNDPLKAAVATGIIWGVWHYPLIFMGYEHYANVWIGLVVFTVSTILLSIIFGWLLRKTGSVWAASMAHGATNNLGLSLSLLLFVGGPHFIFLSYLGILAWVPLGILCVWISVTRS